MSEDRFGDLGPQERSAADRFADLDDGDMAKEREQKAPSAPQPRGRYTWVVGIAALIVIIVVAINSLPNAGRGYSGPKKGEQVPVFAAPSVIGDRSGDANVKQDATDDDTGNETPACDVRGADIINACELYAEKPLVLMLAVPSGDCERQLEAMARLGARRPEVQFAAVLSGRSKEKARQVVEEANIGFPVALDRDLAVFNLYRVAYCSTAFVAKGGKLREFRANQPMSEKEIERRL